MAEAPRFKVVDDVVGTCTHRSRKDSLILVSCLSMAAVSLMVNLTSILASDVVESVLWREGGFGRGRVGRHRSCDGKAMIRDMDGWRV